MSHYFINDESVKHNKKIIEAKYCDTTIKVYTDNGVFSKEHLDYGTKLLLTNFLKESKEGNALDLGCGYGIIGITISLESNIKVDFVDINDRALELTKENIKLNNIENARCWKSNIYENIKDKYNYIITNPPIRAGKETLKKFLFEGKNYLEEDGELWFVMRKDHGVKTMIKELETEYQAEIIDKSKGFYIVRLKKLKKV